MPRADYYDGLTMAEALRAFADHHGAPRTRHITADETALLHRAADRLEQVARASPSLGASGSELAPVMFMPHRAVGS